MEKKAFFSYFISEIPNFSYMRFFRKCSMFRRRIPFRHILVCMKVSISSMYASIYESSGSQFFTTTTGIQSGPDAFDESRFVITFLTILGVTEILCNFRLLIEGKTGKEMSESSRLEFLEKFLANNFALSDAEDNTSGPLKRKEKLLI